MMGNKLCEDSEINHSVRFPGSSAQEYVKSCLQSKGNIDASCILCYKEGSTAPGRPFWHLRKHTPQYVMLHWLICQMTWTASRFEEGPKEGRLVAAVDLETIILTISYHLVRGLEFTNLLYVPLSKEALGNQGGCAP